MKKRERKSWVNLAGISASELRNLETNDVYRAEHASLLEISVCLRET